MDIEDLNLRKKLGKNIVGTHVAMTDSISSDILGSLDYDFVWIDSEHSENNYTSIRNHIVAINAHGTPAIVRVSRNDYNHVKRILEMGPQGLVFPMINTAEEAENAMKYCTYPPYGIRGFGPLRAVGYGKIGLDEYIAKSNDILCRFVQVETVQAVENLEEIVKNPYIDGYIFGPCDLSGSIGELNNIYGENTLNLIRKAIDILNKNGKPAGISLGTTDWKEQKFWHDLGISIISAGTDYDYIFKGAKENLANLRTKVMI